MPDDQIQTPAPEELLAAGESDARLLRSDLAPYWLSAIIESADDAIISKSLEGVIISWNEGARAHLRLHGRRGHRQARYHPHSRRPH
jgi:PAS domain-containing protein